VVWANGGARASGGVPGLAGPGEQGERWRVVPGALSRVDSVVRLVGRGCLVTGVARELLV
jgi:hypothetical protein